MSDHVDFPGHDEQHASPPSEGDFPADFFDDAAPPEAAPVGAGDWPSIEAEPATVEALAEPEDAAEAALPPSAYSKTPTGLPDEPPPTAPVFPIVLGLVMIGMLVAAIFVSKLPPEAKPAPAATAATAAAPAAPAAKDEPAAPPPTDALKKEFGERIDALAAQLKAIEGKVDGLPKPAPAPDLSGVQGKIDALDKSVASFAGFSDKIGKVDDHLAKLDDGMKSIREEVDKLAGDVKKAAEKPAAEKPPAEKPAAAAATPASPPTPAPSTPAPDDATAIAQAVQLFNTAKYQDADTAFTALVANNPKDARVFYYAALSHALATNQFQADAVTKTAAKGAQLERTGVTKPADVDSAFATLPDNLKPWLAYFRKLQ